MAHGMTYTAIRTMDVSVGKIWELREEFKRKHAGDIKKRRYDERDVDRFERDDGYVRCFLRVPKCNGEIDKAVTLVNEAFKYRKEIGVWDLQESSFPIEVWDMKSMYYQGQDMEGFPLLYIDLKLVAPKNKAKGKMSKRFITYQFEKHHRQNPEQMCSVLFDMTGVSTETVNSDITSFIMKCLGDYFPSFPAYLIHYEMPTMLAAAWRFFTSFLSKEVQQRIIFCNKMDIGKYIAPEHLWEHMR